MGPCQMNLSKLSINKLSKTCLWAPEQATPYKNDLHDSVSSRCSYKPVQSDQVVPCLLSLVVTLISMNSHGKHTVFKELTVEV